MPSDLSPANDNVLVGWGTLSAGGAPKLASVCKSRGVEHEAEAMVRQHPHVHLLKRRGMPCFLGMQGCRSKPLPLLHTPKSPGAPLGSGHPRHRGPHHQQHQPLRWGHRSHLALPPARWHQHWVRPRCRRRSAPPGSGQRQRPAQRLAARRQCRGRRCAVRRQRWRRRAPQRQRALTPPQPARVQARWAWRWVGPWRERDRGEPAGRAAVI